MNDYSVYQYARENKLLGMSAIKNKEFREFFENIKIKTVVEIGTHKGMSSAHMAKFAKKIFTFDIEDYKEKYKAWDEFGISERIFYQTIENRQDIKKVLDGIKWDFAFIDGSHTWEDARRDWELVNKCGRVLFHDVHKKAFKGVRKFVDSIGAEISGSMAYWQK